MNSQHYKDETGGMTINGSRMAWTMKRSKGESAFGIRGSRIFELTLTKDGNTVGSYDLGWSKKIPEEDEESTLCLTYLIDRFGRTPKKKEKRK